jgi:hypothetical protein
MTPAYTPERQIADLDELDELNADLVKVAASPKPPAVLSAEDNAFIDSMDDMPEIEGLPPTAGATEEGVPPPDLTCSICLGLVAFAAVLKCGHTYCWECVNKIIIRSDGPTCPICRKPFSRDEMRRNIAIDSLVERYVRPGDRMDWEERKQQGSALAAQSLDGGAGTSGSGPTAGPTANPSIVSELRRMGLDREMAAQAAVATHNRGVGTALNWLGIPTTQGPPAERNPTYSHSAESHTRRSGYGHGWSEPSQGEIQQYGV